ncbi:hypothetical protein HDV00_001674 [Rhizophlyctis rosea]|nr:hypothetical protein HDV00_001674 [Rhizophlyctis rosea]
MKALLTLCALLVPASIEARTLKINGISTNIQIEDVIAGAAKVITYYGQTLPGQIWAERGESVADFQLDLKQTLVDPIEGTEVVEARKRRRSLQKRQPATPTSGLPNVSPVPTATPGVDVYNWYQAVWSANIKIGQTALPVQINTGSSDLWVGNAQCETCGVNGKYVFGSTAVNLTYAVNPSTSGGTAYGYAVQDTVAIGNVSLRNEFVSVYDGAILNGQIVSGLLGLGFSRASQLTQYGYYNWFEAAYRAGKFKFGIFGLYLGTTGNAWGGDLSIGGVNPSKYSGSLA